MSHPNKLAFEFGKMLRHREFRDRIKACGWTNGMDIYPALPWETEDEVRARMEPGRHLLVMPDPDAPFQMRFLVCEVDR